MICALFSKPYLRYDYVHGWARNFPVHTVFPNNPYGINCSYVYLYPIAAGERPKRVNLKGQAILTDIYSGGGGINGHIDAYSIGYFDGSARLYMDPQLQVMESTSGYGSNAEVNFDWWDVFSEYYNGL